MVSTNINVKNTLFLSASPPHPEGTYPALRAAWWADGWVWRDEEEEEEEDPDEEEDPGGEEDELVWSAV